VEAWENAFMTGTPHLEQGEFVPASGQ